MSKRKDIPVISTLSLFQLYSKLADKRDVYLGAVKEKYILFDSTMRHIELAISCSLTEKSFDFVETLFREDFASDLLDEIEKCGYKYSPLAGSFVPLEDDYEPEDFTDALIHGLYRSISD